MAALNLILKVGVLPYQETSGPFSNVEEQDITDMIVQAHQSLKANGRNQQETSEGSGEGANWMPTTEEAQTLAEDPHCCF